MSTHRLPTVQVWPGSTVTSVISAQDDPHHAAQKIQTQWVIDHRVNTAADNGKGLCRIAPTAIRPGDFVDVTVSVDILSYGRGKRARTEVQGSSAVLYAGRLQP